MATAPIQLPPFPANSQPGSWAWIDWWKKFQDYVKSITDVSAQGTIPSATMTGITGTGGTASVRWVVLGNYCQFDIDIPVTLGIDIVTDAATILLTSVLPDQVMPPMLGNGLLYAAAWQNGGGPGVPYVQSLGIGYITTIGGTITAFLPNFTVSGTITTPPPFQTIHITGRYNVS